MKDKISYPPVGIDVSFPPAPIPVTTKTVKIPLDMSFYGKRAP